MTLDDPNAPFHIRLRWVWGKPEFEIVVSASGMVPECFSPDTTVVYDIANIPEEGSAQKLLRLSVANFPVMALAVSEYGPPNLMSMRDLRPNASPSPTLGGPDGIIN